MSEVIIRSDHISKGFKLPHERQSSVKGLFLNLLRMNRTYEHQQALKDVSFEIKKGEFFGIVGRNGSGKSTLLKLLAGIYSPDKGAILVNGSLTPFIELGVGFNPELTGRENVFLNGALLGFNRREMLEMYDEIVDFAELHKFMDQKLKNYSSGMQVRLAFSIAIRAKTDILLLDEVLAVGDEAFQKKCDDYFHQIKQTDVTIVLVTHDMSSVKRFCDRAMLIENGKIKAIGAPTEIANQYSLDNLNTGGADKSTNRKLNPAVKSLSVKNISPVKLTNDQDFEFEISYELHQDMEVDLGIALTHNGQSIIEHNTREHKLGSQAGRLYTVRYKMPLKRLVPKTYGIDVAIFEKQKFELIGFNTGAINFILSSDSGPKGGILNSRGEWIIPKTEREKADHEQD